VVGEESEMKVSSEKMSLFEKQDPNQQGKAGVEEKEGNMQKEPAEQNTAFVGMVR
jgi:hypothetical protein